MLYYEIISEKNEIKEKQFFDHYLTKYNTLFKEICCPYNK